MTYFLLALERGEATRLDVSMCNIAASQNQLPLLDREQYLPLVT